MARPSRKAALKKTATKKKAAPKEDVKSKFGVPIKGKEGTGILMPHLNHRFRVRFNDNEEIYHRLTQNIMNVDVDFIAKKLIVRVRDSAQADNVGRMYNFSKMSGNIEVQYLYLNGVSAGCDKGIIFYGKTTGLTTGYDYANSNPTILTLEFTFHEFTEYIPDET